MRSMDDPRSLPEIWVEQENARLLATAVVQSQAQVDELKRMLGDLKQLLAPNQAALKARNARMEEVTREELRGVALSIGGLGTQVQMQAQRGTWILEELAGRLEVTDERWSKRLAWCWLACLVCLAWLTWLTWLVVGRWL